MTQYELDGAQKIFERTADATATSCDERDVALLGLVLVNEVRDLQRQLAGAIAANLCHVPLVMKADQ
jgi:hypothetical protein